MLSYCPTLDNNIRQQSNETPNRKLLHIAAIPFVLQPKTRAHLLPWKPFVNVPHTPCRRISPTCIFSSPNSFLWLAPTESTGDYPSLRSCQSDTMRQALKLETFEVKGRVFAARWRRKASEVRKDRTWRWRCCQELKNPLLSTRTASRWVVVRASAGCSPLWLGNNYVVRLCDCRHCVVCCCRISVSPRERVCVCTRQRACVHILLHCGICLSVCLWVYVWAVVSRCVFLCVYLSMMHLVGCWYRAEKHTRDARYHRFKQEFLVSSHIHTLCTHEGNDAGLKILSFFLFPAAKLTSDRGFPYSCRVNPELAWSCRPQRSSRPAPVQFPQPRTHQWDLGFFFFNFWKKKNVTIVLGNHTMGSHHAPK